MIDWAGQLRALSEDGFDGFLTIETHFEPKVAGSKQSLQWVQQTLADIHST
jgi:sugar phosphate isomerase/epimerase